MSHLTLIDSQDSEVEQYLQKVLHNGVNGNAMNDNNRNEHMNGTPDGEVQLRTPRNSVSAKFKISLECPQSCDFEMNGILTSSPATFWFTSVFFHEVETPVQDNARYVGRDFQENRIQGKHERRKLFSLPKKLSVVFTRVTKNKKEYLTCEIFVCLKSC